MLATARGLMSDPSVIILDEPSLGLAPKVVGEIMRALATLRDDKGLAVLLVEQNVRAAFTIADRVLVMDRGSSSPKEPLPTWPPTSASARRTSGVLDVVELARRAGHPAGRGHPALTGPRRCAAAFRRRQQPRKSGRGRGLRRRYVHDNAAAEALWVANGRSAGMAAIGIRFQRWGVGAVARPGEAVAVKNGWLPRAGVTPAAGSCRPPGRRLGSRRPGPAPRRAQPRSFDQ